MPLSQAVLILIGLLLAAWTLAAGVVVIVARARLRRAEAARRTMQRFARLVEESPAVPMLVRADGRIEAPQRLAPWFGFDQLPQYLSELEDGSERGACGLVADDLAALTAAVRRAQKTAAPFRQVVTPVGSARRLALRGHLADAQISPGGAALVWVFDVTEAQAPAIEPRQEAQRARDDFPALVALIEAAPQPMWLRGPDGTLRLANAAYATAVGTATPADAVSRQIELVEPSNGRSARSLALRAAEDMQPYERRLTATIAGQRRALRVTDLPLGEHGIFGYAIDIEELEDLTRTFRAYREARRAVTDNMSAAVAQFDAKRRLVFANKPFQRIFAIDRGLMASAPTFERVLDTARHAGKLPEVRDYAEWRRDRVAWFAATSAQKEDWTLTSGVHLNIVAQPEPDGELLLVVEDLTEQLRLSAIRDTMLRTRTATLDSLFESVALFAPDGRMQLWNRRFASDWGLESDYLDTHPHIEPLLKKIAARLKRPADAASVGEAVRSATIERRETGGRVQLADGRTLAYGGVPLPDGSGLLTVLDMTDSQKAEEALRERNAALQDAETVRARFLAELSQEFRLPLKVIGGFAERLRDGLGGELNEFGQDYIGAILSSAQRIEEHIGKLVSLSRAGKSMLPDVREDVALLPLAERLIEERQMQLRQAGLTLDLRGDESVGAVQGDRRRLARAIGHLIDNAIAATPAGGRILVDLSRQPSGTAGDHARIVVSDNGPGMDDVSLRHAIAGQMVLADGTVAFREGELGLPLAHELIRGHGGRLELLSEPGQGTAAIVELP